ncbi:MAG: PAS domain-containing protein [Acidobacteria bacterium]|nr:PAS domain-containing protein [Acidobacteriota bacterium]
MRRQTQVPAAVTEPTLARAEEHALPFPANATAGVAILNADLRYVEISDGLARMHGLTPEEHLGKSVREIVPQLAPVVEPLLRRIIATGEPAFNIQLTGELDGGSGHIHRLVISYIPLYGAEGKPQGICALVAEATEGRASEVENQVAALATQAARREPQHKEQLSEKVLALKNVALALTSAAEILEQAESSGLLTNPDIEDGINFDEEVKGFETRLIKRALKRTHGNQKQAARLLGMKHTTLHTKIKRYGISPT